MYKSYDILGYLKPTCVVLYINYVNQVREGRTDFKFDS